MNQAGIVFVVFHSYETGPESHEESKFIGVYVSRESANAAVEMLSSQPGFRDHPEGFTINAHTLDVTNWTGGFISMGEALDALNAEDANR